MAKDAPRKPRAPRTVDLHLIDLVDESGTELQANADIEGVCITGADVSDRDLSYVRLSEVMVDGLRADGATLRGASLSDCDLRRFDAPTVNAARSRWRTVIVRESRLGSVELFDASLDHVEFVGCRIGYLNARGSRLTDVTLRDCTIDEVDLGGATVTRLAAPDTVIRRLELRGAVNSDVDLTGAQLDDIDDAHALSGVTVSSDQLLRLLPRIAESLGIRVAD